jgi:hypothetical protein
MLIKHYKILPQVGRGMEFLAFAFDVVGDLVDLVKDITVAVYEVGDLGGCVHNG